MAIDLPQGAQITKITAYYYDSYSGSAPLIDLDRGITDTLQLIGNLSSAFPSTFFASGEDIRSLALERGGSGGQQPL